MEVDGVKHLLDGAIENAESAGVLIYRAISQLEEAGSKIRMVRQTSVDPVGYPALLDMMDLLTQAIQREAIFKEQVTAYRQML